MRVLSGRGIQNALGFDPKGSGKNLMKMLENKGFRSNFLDKSVHILNRLENDKVEFERNTSGGSAPITHGNDEIIEAIRNNGFKRNKKSKSNKQKQNKEKGK